MPKTPEIKALDTAMANRDGEAAAKAIRAIQDKHGNAAAGAVITDIIAGAAVEMQRRKGQTG